MIRAAFIFAILGIASNAQTTLPGIPIAMNTAIGTGAPTATCAGPNPSLYVQTDATTGRLWTCSNSTGTWAWEHMLSPVAAAADPTAFMAAIKAASPPYLSGVSTSITTALLSIGATYTATAIVLGVVAGTPCEISPASGVANAALYVRAMGSSSGVVTVYQTNLVTLTVAPAAVVYNVRCMP